MINLCKYGIYKTVEVCGGVCEAAEGCGIRQCPHNRKGKTAEAVFQRGLDREYPLEEP